MKHRTFQQIATFFSGPKFPAFMLLAMLFYQIFLAVTIFAPIGDSFWGKFMTDFRVWCFGYDPNSGSMQWTAAWIMLTEPILLQVIIIVLWRKSLVEMLRYHPRQLFPQLSAALATVALIAGSLLWMAAADVKAAEAIPAFPGERIRTTLQPPTIELTNQHGESVKLADYAGEVVLLTAIYSTCATACPMIMFQAKEVIENLTQEQPGPIREILGSPTKAHQKYLGEPPLPKAVKKLIIPTTTKPSPINKVSGPITLRNVLSLLWLGFIVFMFFLQNVEASHECGAQRNTH